MESLIKELHKLHSEGRIIAVTLRVGAGVVMPYDGKISPRPIIDSKFPYSELTDNFRGDIEINFFNFRQTMNYHYNITLPNYKKSDHGYNFREYVNGIDRGYDSKFLTPFIDTFPRIEY